MKIEIGTWVNYTERAASVVRVCDTDFDTSPPYSELVPREIRRPLDFGCIVKKDLIRMERSDTEALMAMSLNKRKPFRFEIPLTEGYAGGNPGDGPDLIPLTRWVLRWPRHGGGYVTGLQVRQQGRVEGSYGNEGGGHYLQTFRSAPPVTLLEIKTLLRQKPILVPKDAITIPKIGRMF